MTQNLKAAVDVLISLGMAVEVSQRDGFQLTDVLAFIPALSFLPAVLKNKAEIVEEFKAMDKASKEVLFADAVAKFSIENARVEKIIEAGFDLLLTGALFVKAVQA